MPEPIPLPSSSEQTDHVLRARFVNSVEEQHVPVHRKRMLKCSVVSRLMKPTFGEPAKSGPVDRLVSLVLNDTSWDEEKVVLLSGGFIDQWFY